MKKKHKNLAYLSILIIVIVVTALISVNSMSMEKKKANLLAKGDYACCLKEPCHSCLAIDPWHGEGATCTCLEDVVNGVHPCGECVGGILSGRGNPYLKQYFAKAIAEEVGEEYLDELNKIIEEKYPD